MDVYIVPSVLKYEGMIWTLGGEEVGAFGIDCY